MAHPLSAEQKVKVNGNEMTDSDIGRLDLRQCIKKHFFMKLSLTKDIELLSPTHNLYYICVVVGVIRYNDFHRGLYHRLRSAVGAIHS